MASPIDQSEFNRGVDLRESGRLEESRKVLEAVLAERVKLLGETHHETVCARSQLGRTLREAGDRGSALRLHEENLVIRRRLLGDGHPWTKNAMRILADTLDSMGEQVQASTLRAEARLKDSEFVSKFSDWFAVSAGASGASPEETSPILDLTRLKSPYDFTRLADLDTSGDQASRKRQGKDNGMLAG